MEAKLGGQTENAKGWDDMMHALREGWDYGKPPILALCGPEITGVRHNQNSDVIITCKNCLRILGKKEENK